MIIRLLSTGLLSTVYRIGKRHCKTASMCSSPRSQQADTCEQEVAESSACALRQENSSEHLCRSGVCIDSVEKLEICAVANSSASDDGTKLSKRALKRLRRCQLKQESGQKKCKTVCDTELQQHSEVITKETLSGSDYYFQDGLRKVYPYYFDFKTYTKERWFGLTLESVFVKEFHTCTSETVKKLVELQALTVNGNPVHADYVLKNGDLIQNHIHRHELPVTADPVEILAETDELLVVNKPSSIPIHPCGRYRFNCLLYILAKENGLRHLRGIYRLDRLTSGIVIFSKTEAKTRELMELMKKHQLQKEYLCRVDGEFPSEQVDCNEPIDVLSHKLGVHRVGAGGKEARTVFDRMSYNGKTSVVKCFPIANDPIYTGSVWGPNRGKGGDFGKSDTQLLTELEVLHSRLRYLLTDSDDTDQQTPVDTSTDVEAASEGGQADQLDSITSLSKQEHTAQVKNSAATHLPVFDPSKVTFDPECRDCKRTFRNPEPEELMIYLHAYCYQGPDWCFKTSLPQWAQNDWTD